MLMDWVVTVSSFTLTLNKLLMKHPKGLHAFLSVLNRSRDTDSTTSEERIARLGSLSGWLLKSGWLGFAISKVTHVGRGFW